MQAACLPLVIAVALVAVKADKLQGSSLVASQALRAAVKNAEPLFNTRIAAGLEALPVIPMTKASHMAGNDLFFQIDSDTTVEVKDVHVVSAPLLNVSSVNADLEYFNMAVEGNVGTIVVDGNFSISSLSSFKILPLVSEGSFRLVLESVTFKGYTGLRVAGDSLLTENYDIDYVPAAIILTANYYTPHGPVKTQISTRSFDETVIAKIKARLRSVMNRHMKKQFDAVASEFSLKELLLDDEPTITSFMSHSRAMTANVNEYVDALIAEITKQLTSANLRTINIPAELHASFSKVILWVTWRGSFTATGAWAKDLATIRRTGDMSIVYDGGVLTVFGSLGLGNLQVGFNHYHAEFMDIGPSGTVSATVGSNSLFFKVRVDMRELQHATATIEELYVEYIDDIDLEVTGLGILNWLVSQIATWVLGFFTDSIAPFINKYLQDIASTSVSLVNPLDYLQ
ncbi:uncharacterized protein LOC126237795 [Schistocerca nitens]|uniref:uncharacterized protein LOC126237795 n=1 Tax=Schistocerca nitens TaxID=7011 RepID=UPI0021187803|nr:uncharacterized protein LOC126237795 [Schistocerca nitens]